MRKGLLRTSLSTIFIIALLVFSINYESFAIETGVILEEDVITLFAGANATDEDKTYQFTLKGSGLAASDCIWRLSDYTYLTVDDKGMVTLKENIKNSSDILSVTLTVSNTSTNESDTALIFIETDPPLGAVIMTKSMYKDIYVEPTLNPAVVNVMTKPAMTKDMFKEQYVEPTLNPVVVNIITKPVMTKDMFKEQYVEPTLNPVVVTITTKPVMTKDMFKDKYVEPTLNPAVVTVTTKPVMTKDMFKEQYVEPTLNPVVVNIITKPVMTKDMFKEQYMEPTLDPVVIPSTKKDDLEVPTNSYEFFIKYEEESLSN